MPHSVVKPLVARRCRWCSDANNILAKVILNTFGSFGDLHPYLAIAIELKNRGHYPLIATSEVYRAKIEAEGISFAPVRPNVGELLGKTQSLKKLWGP